MLFNTDLNLNLMCHKSKQTNGSFTLPGTGTGTGTENSEMGMQPNGFLSLSQSLCSVYST